LSLSVDWADTALALTTRMKGSRIARFIGFPCWIVWSLNIA
jgi:hypothetical protein